MTPVRTFRDRSFRRHMLPVCALLVAATAVAGCGGSGGKADTTPTPTASASISASPTADPTAAAKKQVAAVFRHMLDEEAKAYQLGYTSKTHYADYVADPALGKTNSQLFQYRQDGVVFKGRPKSTFTVTAVDLASTPHKATVQECFDMHGWQPVLKATGKPVGTTGQTLRYTIISTVQTVGTGSNAKWKVTDYTVDKAQPC